MSLPRTLALRLLLFLGGAITAAWLVAFLILDAQLRRIVDRSQSAVFDERLAGVGRLLETRVRRLEATGMPAAYEEDFKASALKTLRELYHDEAAGDAHLIVLDRAGGALLHPHGPGWGASPERAELVRHIGGAAAGEVEVRGGSAGSRWGIFRRFGPWGWTLVYTVPLEAKYADLRLVHRAMSRVVVVSTLTVLGLFFAIITALTRPIARLTRAASAMAAGDLDRPLEPGGAETGEVGALAASFSRMRDAIRERIAELRATNESLRREIAQREEVESRLQQSEELHRSIVASLDDLVFVLDRHRRFVAFSQPAKLGALFIPPESFVGRLLADIPFPEEARRAWLDALESLASGPEVQSFDYSLPMPQGETWYSAKASRRIDARGAFAGVTVVVRDITRRRQAAQELERQNVELRKLDRLKDDLVRNVSHELKTPVAKLAMQLEVLRSLLEERARDPGVAKVLAVMDSSVKRQRQMISNLLDLARLQAGRGEVAQEVVRLDTVLAGVVEEYRALTEAAGLAVALQAEPVAVRGDRQMLWHVFSNLVSNAYKYRRPEGGGRIDVRVSRAGGSATVVVADDGRGMSAEEQRRAFEKFYQASAAVEGSGVGLTIAREMTELLGGAIALRSEGHGRGTAVTVTLPAVPEG